MHVLCCVEQVAASDTDPAVVNQALDALQPVVEALYSGVGAPLRAVPSFIPCR